MPVDVGLDDDVAGAALRQRARERARGRRLVGAQVEVDAAAVVAVERLDDAREADPLRGRDRRVLASSTTSARGTGRPAESSSRLVRLLSDAMSTAMADGLRGHRRPDALLVDALAELDEASGGRGG